MEDALLDFQVSVENCIEYKQALKDIGYTECSGSAAYDRPYLTVLPFRKKFWGDTSRARVHLEVEEITRTIIEHKLKCITQ